MKKFYLENQKHNPEAEKAYNQNVTDVIKELGIIDYDWRLFFEYSEAIAKKVEDSTLEYVVCQSQRTNWIKEWVTACENELVERGIFENESVQKNI